MTVRVGLIGCGVMGSDHARILKAEVAGAELVAVYDADQGRAQSVAASAEGTRAFASASALIADSGVDAVIVASPDETHAPLAIACIAAGKPALCEKPLASTLDLCRAVIAAEMKAGRRLVQVGFMRRFDPGYRAMKRRIGDSGLGRPLFLHCVHRNAVAPSYITSDLVLANSAVHEFDISRFLLGEEFAVLTVTSGPPSRHAETRRPQFVVMESASGIVVTIEVFVDAQYGYDVQAELVCENGTASLAPHRPLSERRASRDGYDVEGDWRQRFADAYRVQLQEWVAAIAEGRAVGASAWDGYVASLTAAAALEARATGAKTKVAVGERPKFYD
jgi:myo-inositol 2-dehydrogenase/D-chiro-inositol 1-dehydrogenase